MKKIILAGFLLLLLAACTEETWTESTMFEAGGYDMIGEKDKIGFIFDDSEVVRFYPDKEQKYMWHLWGEDIPFGKEFKVIGISQEKDIEIMVFEVSTLGGANNGADAHVPSLMSLPEPGMWKLDAYVDDELFGSVYVKVHEE